MRDKLLNSTVAPAPAPVADAEAHIAALTERLTKLADVVNTLAVASLAPRISRTRKATSAVSLTAIQAICAQAGFRDGSERNKLFSDLFSRGSGDYPLSDFPYAKTSDAHVVSRRLARKGLPFSLAVDGEERGNARLIFADFDADSAKAPAANESGETA
jgi:hypothetical protein